MIRFVLRRAGFLVAVAVLNPQAAVPKGLAVSLPIEALAHTENVSTFRISPDGQMAAMITLSRRSQYVSSGVDYSFGSFRGTLRVINTETGATTPIESVNGDISTAEWSPDSAQLAYVAGTEDMARVWVWSRGSGRTSPVDAVVPRTIPRSLNSKPVWLPNSRGIVIAALPLGMKNRDIQRRDSSQPGTGESPIRGNAEGSVRIKVYNSAAISNSSVHSSESRGQSPRDFATLDLYLTDLTLIDLQKSRVHRLTSGQRPINYSVSPDGSTISYLNIRGSADGSAYRTRVDVTVIDIESRRARVVVGSVLQSGRPIETSWSPNSKWLAFFDSGTGAKHQCYVVDAKTGLVRSVRGPLHSQLATTEIENTTFPAPIWTSPDKAFALIGDGTSQLLWAIEVDEHGVHASIVRPNILDNIKLLSIVGVADSSRKNASLLLRIRNSLNEAHGFGILEIKTSEFHTGYEQSSSIGETVSLSRSGSVLFCEQRADRPLQLFVTDTKSWRLRQLTRLNSHLNAYAFGKSSLIRWTGPDGKLAAGALLLPAEHKPGVRYPLVVQVYGGSRGSVDVNTFGLTGTNPFADPYDNRQVLSTRGYATLFADTSARIGHPMADIAEGVLAAVDHVIKLGIADPNRMAILGHSYGGYSALSVLVSTDRFKAAVVSAGSSNLIASYSNMAPDGTGWRISWVEEGQGRMGGSLWKYRERFIENSPLFFLDRVTTPVLLMHGTADAAVSIREADEIFLSLQRLRKPVQYVQYIGEGHNIDGSENMEDRATRTIAWLGKYLMKNGNENEDAMTAEPLNPNPGDAAPVAATTRAHRLDLSRAQSNPPAFPGRPSGLRTGRQRSRSRGLRPRAPVRKPDGVSFLEAFLFPAHE